MQTPSWPRHGAGMAGNLHRGSQDPAGGGGPGPAGLLARVTLATGSLIVGLLIAELVLRITGYGLIAPELQFGVNASSGIQRGVLVPDRNLFWTLRQQPSPLDEAVNAVHPRRPIPAKGKRPRIVLLGDSCTALSIQGMPYPGILRGMLAGDVEILTAAVPGYSSYQGLTWLRTQLLAARPDLVVIYFGWNDHWRSLGTTDRAYAASISPWRPRLLTLFSRRPSTPPLRVSAADYGDNLMAMAKAVTDAGGSVVMIRAPSHLTAEARAHLVTNRYLLETDDAQALHDEHLRVLDGAAAATGVAVVDAAAIFTAAAAAPVLIMPDGIHLTPAGHRAMTAILLETIRCDVLHQPADGRPLVELALDAAFGPAARAGERKR